MSLPLSTANPESSRAFIKRVWPARITYRCFELWSAEVEWRHATPTLGHPSCFPAIEGMSLALTFEKSQWVRRCSRRCNGTLGCCRCPRQTQYEQRRRPRELTPLLMCEASAGAAFSARRTRMNAAGKSSAAGSCATGEDRFRTSCTHAVCSTLKSTCDTCMR